MDRSVGRGTGPTTRAPVRCTCSMICPAALSSSSWSYARSLILIFGPANPSSLLRDLGHPSGPDGPAALPDGEPEALLHGDGLLQGHGHLHVVPGHDHLRPLRQLDLAGHVGRPEVELGLVALHE